MINIAIFASGSGTNAQRITEYFLDHKTCSVALILSNNKDAYVLERARNLGISAATFNRQEFYETSFVTNLLKEHSINFIILAGFLWMVPSDLLLRYPERILNIHPALLPKYGGKGMYGMRVHEAIISNHDKESGITIHLVNDQYDKGKILFQAKCNVEEIDTPLSLANKIHILEYRYFPLVIENYILKGTPFMELSD
jgi:phosphoribosylglycinamide formyltransferase-1